jgi:SM-20-related protein
MTMAAVRLSAQRFLPIFRASNWLNGDTASGLLSYAIQNQSRFEAGNVVRQGRAEVDTKYRDAAVLRDLGEFREPLRSAALAVKPQLEQAFGMPPFAVKRVEIELAAHGDGGHFERHIDTLVLVNQAPSTRILTLLLYLNREPKAFSGGALRMYAIGSEGTRDVEPGHNLLVAFPAVAPHSVERVVCHGSEFADRRFAVNICLHR